MRTNRKEQEARVAVWIKAQPLAEADWLWELLKPRGFTNSARSKGQAVLFMVHMGMQSSHSLLAFRSPKSKLILPLCSWFMIDPLDCCKDTRDEGILISNRQYEALSGIR